MALCTSSFPSELDVLVAIKNQPNENVSFDFLIQRLANAEALMQNKNTLIRCTNEHKQTLECETKQGKNNFSDNSSGKNIYVTYIVFSASKCFRFCRACIIFAFIGDFSFNSSLFSYVSASSIIVCSASQALWKFSCSFHIAMIGIASLIANKAS